MCVCVFLCLCLCVCFCASHCLNVCRVPELFSASKCSGAAGGQAGGNFITKHHPCRHFCPMLSNIRCRGNCLWGKRDAQTTQMVAPTQGLPKSAKVRQRFPKIQRPGPGPAATKLSTNGRQPGSLKDLQRFPKISNLPKSAKVCQRLPKISKDSAAGPRAGRY